MKTKAILLAIATILLVACNNTTETTADKVERAFKEYVKTDFGDPKDFIEITYIGEPDTTSNETTLKIFRLTDGLSYMLTEKQRKEVRKMKDRLIDEPFLIEQYPVKVRLRTATGQTVKEYYVVNYDGKWFGQDHTASFEDRWTPEVLDDAILLMQELSQQIKKWNEL